MKIKMIVETVTGSVHTSSIEDYDDDEMKELQKICKNIKIASYFSFKDEQGNFLFFNPDRIVVAAMKIVDDK